MYSRNSIWATAGTSMTYPCAILAPKLAVLSGGISYLFCRTKCAGIPDTLELLMNKKLR